MSTKGAAEQECGEGGPGATAEAEAVALRRNLFPSGGGGGVRAYRMGELKKAS